MSSDDRGLQLVLTFFTDTWSDAVRRGNCFTMDRCVIEAARDPRVSHLVVANAPRSAPLRVVRRLQGDRIPPLPPSAALTRLLQPVRLRRSDPVSGPALRRAYVRYDRWLGQEVERAGMRRPAVITASPFVAAYAPLEWAGSVTYYGYDDWAALPALRRWWGAIDDAYEVIRRSGRNVAAVSRPIIERIDPTGAREVIPNGVEPAEWRHAGRAPSWSSEVARPMILYLGNLGERRDIPLLERTAEAFPDGEVVLVGVVGDTSLLEQLSHLRNVRVAAPVGRGDVAGLVMAADVCIMPHHSTRLTRSMSPLKLFEYLAGGRPVVVPDLPPVRDVDPRVVVVPVGDDTGFAAGVRRALELGPVDEAQRLRFIEANSWASRFDQLVALAVGSTVDTRTVR